MVFGAFSEISEEARKLLCYAADLALLKNRLYRRWGINTPREYARIKIYVSAYFSGNLTSRTRSGTATTTHASTTGRKLTYTLAGDSSPVTPLGARPRNPN